MSTKLDSLAMPDVATIRKGDAKVKTTKNGREIETVGPDLKDRFRVVFHKGAEEYQKIFEAKYHTLKPERIRAMVMARSVWDSWSWANEAYTAGRMIAKADDKHFLTLRDPLTGEYKVQNGEPYMDFQPGMTIPYSRDGKNYELKIRTVGRLRLFVPEMERLVQFNLKTTSYYDRLNIDRQLGTIQMLADTLNGGNAAGIPLQIFRMEQDVTWNKPDGSAAQVKKWLVNIEADSEWVRAATSRLAKFALTGEITAGLLNPPAAISGAVEPEAEEVDENPEDAEIIDAVAVDPKPEPDPLRYPADVLKITLAEHASSIRQSIADGKRHGCTETERKVLAAALGKVPSFDQNTVRYETCEYLTGTASTKSMPGEFVLALLDWLKVRSFDDEPSAMSKREAIAAHSAALLAKGQTKLPLA